MKRRYLNKYASFSEGRAIKPFAFDLVEPQINHGYQVEREGFVPPTTSLQNQKARQSFVMSRLPSHRNSTFAFGIGPDFPVQQKQTTSASGESTCSPLMHAGFKSASQFRTVPSAKKQLSFIAPRDRLLEVAEELFEDDIKRHSIRQQYLHEEREEKRKTIIEDVHRYQKTMAFRERLKSVVASLGEKKAFWENEVDLDLSLRKSKHWKFWEKTQSHLADIWKQLDFWSSHFKEIEGRFGNATASYFRFTRWLLFLNIYNFLVSFLIIVVPFLAAEKTSAFEESLEDNKTVIFGGLNLNKTLFIENKFHDEAKRCSATYMEMLNNITHNEPLQNQVLDFFIGTGWMEKTSMFYGYYHNLTFNAGDHNHHYNMNLAYLLAIGATFLVNFILILANSSHSIKATVVDDQAHSSVYFTNSVLCGWDYCIFDEKTAKSKQSILYQEFKADLLEQAKRLQRQNRTNRQRLVLVIIRIVVNIVVLCILGAAFFLIYFTTSKLLDLAAATEDRGMLLIIQLLPPITITILNAVIPEIFIILVSLEDYWPTFELKITLIRTVFVRLATIGVLTVSLYSTLLWPNPTDFYCAEERKTGDSCCGNFLWLGQKTPNRNKTSSVVKCWETYVGQQFYKLAIVDFAAVILVTFVFEFPRKFIYDRFKEKSALVRKFAVQEFEISRNVLDIVYSQVVSWIGSTFSPLLPGITLLKVIVIFYIKKLTLMKNYEPPQHVYRVSRSKSFFNIILLISFVLVSIIVGYMIGHVPPSKSCGPYRIYSDEKYVIWNALIDVISGWPSWASKFFFFFGTTAFYVPCFILLCLLMYYYWAVGQGFKRKEEILQEQLRLEGKDKQFLLARVNDILKQDGDLQFKGLPGVNLKTS